MKRVTIQPDGWPVKIEECPPGHFMYEDQLCFKSEYMTSESDYKDIEVFNSGGEYFMPREVLVQPVTYEITEEEE